MKKISSGIRFGGNTIQLDRVPDAEKAWTKTANTGKKLVFHYFPVDTTSTAQPRCQASCWCNGVYYFYHPEMGTCLQCFNATTCHRITYCHMSIEYVAHCHSLSHILSHIWLTYRHIWSPTAVVKLEVHLVSSAVPCPNLTVQLKWHLHNIGTKKINKN